MSHRGFVILTSILLLATSSPVAGQLRYGGDLSLVTRYEWRGITRGSGMSLQPAVFAGLGSELRVSGGGWANIQLGKRDPARGIGFARQWFGEANVWAEVSFAEGPFDLAAGWIGYFFDAGGAVTPGGGLVDTHELYARVRAVTIPILMPSLSYYHDVDAFDGGYLEPAVTIRVPFWPQAVLPLGSMFVGAKAGFSLGQEVELPGPPADGHFGERGLTHWDVSVSFPMVPSISLGPLELAPILEGHMQLNRDPLGRIKVGSGMDDGVTFWGRFGLTVIGPRCRPDRRVCNP